RGQAFQEARVVGLLPAGLEVGDVSGRQHEIRIPRAEHLIRKRHVARLRVADVRDRDHAVKQLSWTTAWIFSPSTRARIRSRHSPHTPRATSRGDGNRRTPALASKY